MTSQRDGGVSWTNPPGYAGESWNLVRGCAERCGARCWAERQAIRQAKPGEPYARLVASTPQGPRWTGRQRFVAEKLSEPIHWRDPRCVGVSLMGDLFGSGITVRQIAQAYAVMVATPQHRYCVLTKQAERRRQILSDPGFAGLVEECGEELAAEHEWCHANPAGIELPASNVVELVSCSDQATVDSLVPILLQTPAAWRGLSLEPQLGAADLKGRIGFDATWDRWVGPCGCPEQRDPWTRCDVCTQRGHEPGPVRGLDWVIVGPETGAGKRYCDPEHQAAVVRQCVEARVAVHVKAVQLGKEGDCKLACCKPRVSRNPDEWPTEMRVREWPEAFREVPR